MNYKVVLRRENSIKEISLVVTAFNEQQAVIEAKNSYQWRFGYHGGELIVVAVVTESDVDNLIRVIPVSNRGKQLVSKHGSMWRHIEGPHPMQCFDGAQGISIGTVDGCDYQRNIRLSGDKVFFWDYLNGEENAL